MKHKQVKMLQVAPVYFQNKSIMADGFPISVSPQGSQCSRGSYNVQHCT